MILINGKSWNELTSDDIEQAIMSGEESFFFEFKDDRVDGRKLTEEISALANTYGGYIFLGISDDKSVIGCTAWTEQRIHTMIHDALSPVPDFDVQKFLMPTGKNVLVIKIEEGLMPPYITSRGKIYERLSSGSFEIKDSARLVQMFYKREEQLKQIEKMLFIKPLEHVPDVVSGYLDMGFSLKTSGIQETCSRFFETDWKKISPVLAKTGNGYSLSRVGSSIIISIGTITNPLHGVIGNLHNFMELFCDGSVRIRILLTNERNTGRVNIAWITTVLQTFREIYMDIFGKKFADLFIGAYKYEKLTVLKQFIPFLQFDGDDTEELNREWESSNIKHKQYYGENLIISDSRIPLSGLNILDKRYMEEINIKDTSEDIIGELFRSNYNFMGYVEIK